MTDHNFDLPDLTAALLAARTGDELNQALTNVVASAERLNAEGVLGHKLFMRELDRALADLPRRLGLPDMPAAKTGNDNVVLIASQFYNVGGHTRVAADLLRLIGRENVTLIVTSIYSETQYRNGAAGLAGAVDLSSRALLILKSRTALEKLYELYNMLAAIRPSRILLLNHHMDACAVTAAMPFRDVTEYLHHTDLNPGVGASMPFRHVDLVYNTFLNCHANGVDSVFASLNPPGPPPRPDEAEGAAQPGEGEVVIGTSGHLMKYTAKAATPWPQWVGAALSVPNSRIVHIGPVSEDFARWMKTALEHQGVDPSRYLLAGPVKSVREELKARGVNLYLASAPIGGGLAHMEALSAGIPVIIPVDPDQLPLIRFKSLLPGWTDALSPEELPGLIARRDELRQQLLDPATREQVDREFGRFARFAAGEVSPVPVA